MKAIDVFAGVGGMHMAARQAGFEVPWACEADPDCRDVYAANHGFTPHPDIAGVDPGEVPDHQLCLAGLPCTPYSVAGRGRGLDDGRANVFVGLLKLLRAKRPECVLVENVPGLVRQDGGRAFRMIRECLKGLGYRVSWSVLAATEFGGATLRRRVYVVTSRVGRFDFAKLGRRPAGRLADILNGADDGWLAPHEYTLLDRPRIGKSGLIFVGYRNKPMRDPAGNVRNPSNHRQQNRVYSAEGVGPTISAQDQTARYWVALGGRVRKLVTPELVKLMGFPADFEWVHPCRQVRQIGNSVHVHTVAAICRGIAEQLLGVRPVTRREEVLS
jgi:DNA (cytosine-5)-methyltransferase 1